MQPTTDPSAPGSVRPRYDDGTFDEPLPLEDHVLERVVTSAVPGRLVVVGARGSGLSTLIERLREAARAAGKRPLGLADLLAPRTGEAWRALDAGDGVLLLDLSGDALDSGALAAAGLLLQDARLSRVVVAASSHDGTLSPTALTLLLEDAELVALAPWTWDDVIELLGAPRFRERRAQLLTALRGVPGADALVARPRAALWLIEAALALPPDAPVTLCSLYANVLDTLGPGTLQVLRRLPHDGDLTVDGLARALALDAPELDVAEVSALFELSRDLAQTLVTPPAVPLAARWATMRSLGWAGAQLLLPGLHHMLQAGDCLAAVAKDAPPPRIARAWFPYLRELMSEPLRARLRGWLTEPGREAVGDAQAATLLWVCGEIPPLDTARRAQGLDGAWLQGVSLPGRSLVGLRVAGSDLSRARLEGADLTDASIAQSKLDGVDLDGARLRGARLRASLRGASLRGVDATGAQVTGCDLREANLEGARLDGGRVGACHLEGACLRGASLRDAKLFASPVVGADLGDLDLERAHVGYLDLARAARFSAARAGGAIFAHCGLVGVDLSELDGAGSRWLSCELLEAALRGARLQRAWFEDCQAHGAVFDGADLRGATFLEVRFQIGSSRAGLLAGKPALEGNMTGYYVEGTTDDAWASPASIRQASFRGADLRGATFRETNLFRVDLRDALLGADVREQAREQGAILD